LKKNNEKSSSAISAVWLDLGQVVFRVSILGALEVLGIDPESKEGQFFRTLTNWEPHDRYEKGKIDTAQFCEEIQKGIGVRITREDFPGVWNKAIFGLVDGVEEVIASLKVPVYALTNSNPVHIQTECARYPVMNRFERVFTSYEMGLRKPDPEIYRQVASATSTALDEVLFLDDREENLTSARELGIHAEYCKVSAEKMREIFCRSNLI